MPDRKTIFNKPALTVSQQIELLSSRKLVIPNEDEAKHYLEFIGYYRLSGYAHCFCSDATTHEYRPGTTFNQILELYIFDRELRLLLMDAIERIEVAVRSAISNAMSIQHEPHWYLSQNLFSKSFRYDQFIQSVAKETGFNQANHSNPIFSNYYNKYKEPKYPPSWMVAEALSLGAWSKLFEYLASSNDKRAIANKFGLHYVVLTSWLHSLTFLRNICAHHARVWNRHFHITPCVPRKIPENIQKHFRKNQLVYAQIAMINRFLKVVSPGTHFRDRLKTLKSMIGYP